MINRKAEDVSWIQQPEERWLRASAFQQWIGTIYPPSDKYNFYRVSTSRVSFSNMITFDIRDEHRIHTTLESAKQALIDAYLGIEEKPDDICVTGQLKAWNDREWILSDEEYQNAKSGLAKEGPCINRFCGAISHGADIAGRTKAALYLTSKEMTRDGYVMRLAFWENTVSKVPLDEAPAGLSITGLTNQ